MKRLGLALALVAGTAWATPPDAPLQAPPSGAAGAEAAPGTDAAAAPPELVPPSQPEGLVVKRARVVAEGGPEDEVQVEGGCWLSTRKCTEAAQRLAAAEATAASLQDAPVVIDTDSPLAVVGLLAGGFVAGVLVGVGVVLVLQ